MNSNHYPNLELCKKLKEIGFPETELYYDSHAINKVDWYWITTDWEYPCPSVMEMLDVMPNCIKNNWGYPLKISRTKWGTFIVAYQDWKFLLRDFIWDNLPNALASMLIWLVENKYLTFNK